MDLTKVMLSRQRMKNKTKQCHFAKTGVIDFIEVNKYALMK